MICYALSMLKRTGQKITLYEVLEQDLKELPEVSRKVINQMGAINIVPTDMTMEKGYLLKTIVYVLQGISIIF